MTQIPDSISADLLRKLVGVGDLARNAKIDTVEYGDLNKFEGLYDFYMLICLAIDGPKKGKPNPIQIMIAACGLVSGLTRHMESCLEQIAADNCDPSAQAILDGLPRERAEQIRKGVQAKGAQDLRVMRQAARLLEKMKQQMIVELCLVHHGLDGQRRPAGHANEFTSDRFLTSIGVTREEFDACVERPAGL